MKTIFTLAVVTFLITGCATNGGPFDAHFWVKGGKLAIGTVVDKVPEVVKKPVEDVVEVVTTPDKDQPCKHKRNKKKCKK